MLSNDTQSVLLLTSYFSKPKKGQAKPLTPTEWGRFASWLNTNKKTPGDLFTNNPKEMLEGWSDKRITIERVIELLGRGNAMALAMEKWTRAGIWVLTRSDQNYPRLLKQRLKENSPPILFGSGNKQLLNQRGIAVIGSRNVEKDDLEFTRAFGAKTAESGYSIVSGGAKGVDETAMLGALQAQGTAIGVMANGLLQTTVSKKWRKNILSNNLVLISPFYPEAGFNVGNAMGRNKYIYCLSDTAVVVHSGKKGGTWTGALENLKKQWIPLWVKHTNDNEAGNEEIVSSGASWCDSSIEDLKIDQLFNQEKKPTNKKSNPMVEQATNINDLHSINKNIRADSSNSAVNFYQVFLTELERLTKNNALDVNEVSEQMQLKKTQIQHWLKLAVENNDVEKLIRPVRYKVTNNESHEQIGLRFG